MANSGAEVALFHLNLFVWLSWPVPTTLAIRPVFFDAGYVLYRIGFGLPIEPAHLIRMRERGLLYKAQPVPDFLFRNVLRKTLLSLECKASGFGPDDQGRRSHQAVQARSLLCTTGEAVADYCGLASPAGWRAHLAFAVGGDGEDNTQETIAILKQSLSDTELPALDGSAIGVLEKGDGLYLRLASNAPPIEGVLDNPGESIRVIELYNYEEARFLYIIPWDPDIGEPGPLESVMFEDRLRASLFALVGAGIGRNRVTFSVDEVLDGAFLVWDQWKQSGPAGRVRFEVRRYVRALLRRLENSGLRFRSEGYDIEIDSVAPKDVRRIQREARKLLSRTIQGHDAIQLSFADMVRE